MRTSKDRRTSPARASICTWGAWRQEPAAWCVPTTPGGWTGTS